MSEETIVVPEEQTDTTQEPQTDTTQEQQIDAAIDQAIEERGQSDEGSEGPDAEAKGGNQEEEGTTEVQDGDVEASGDSGDESAGKESEDVAQESVPQQQQVISDEALAQAVSAGISVADARAFSDEQSLRNVTTAVLQSRQTDQAQQQQTQQQQQEEDPLDKLTLDPEQYEPEVVQTFEALKQEIKSQRETIGSLKQEQEQVAQSSQEQQAREVTQWFDSQVNSLDKDLKSAVGEGGINDLQPGSLQRQKRESIANQMSVMLAGYNATGQEPPPREEVFQSAARLVLADEYDSLNEKRLSKKLQSRSGQHMQRASSDNTKVGGSGDPAAEVAKEIDAMLKG